MGDLLNCGASFGDRLPPAVVRDAEGKPMSSWRFVTAAQLLNDRVQPGYYGQDCRGDLPWDSRDNRRCFERPLPRLRRQPAKLHRFQPAGQQGPLCGRGGAGTAFDDGKPRRLDELPANALLVVEVRGCQAHWMEPRGDLDVRTMPEEIGGEGCIGPAAGGRREFYVGFADRSVWLLRPIYRSRFCRGSSRSRRHGARIGI